MAGPLGGGEVDGLPLRICAVGGVVNQGALIHSLGVGNGQTSSVNIDTAMQLRNMSF
jgi:hypothetical protein